MRGVVVASLVADVTVYFVSPVHNVRLPRSIAAMDLLLTLALVARRAAARAHGDRAAGLRTSSRAARRSSSSARATPGRLIVQEMQRSRMLNVHADRLRRRRPAQEGTRGSWACACSARSSDLPQVAARAPAGRGADRDAVRLRRRAPQDRRDGAGVEGSREDAAGAVRADLRRPQPRRADPAGAGRGRPRPRAGRGRLRAGRVVSPRTHGARHRRGRLDRLGALPPDRARRPGAADPRRQRRDGAVRDRARARRRARLHRRGSEARST